MTKDEVKQRLTVIFRDIFDNDDIVFLDDATTAKDIVGWDSLMHVTLMVEIEDEFGISIPMKDKGSMKNVGEMVDKILSLCP